MKELGGWPLDSEGKPMALVTAGGSEKIGLPGYSNVDIGPMSVQRFVHDDPESIRAGFRLCIQIWEQVAGEERQAVVDAVNEAKQGTVLDGGKR